MRLTLLLSFAAFAGCAAPGGQAPISNLATQPVPSSAQIVSACTPQAVLSEGRETRQYPANCSVTPQLQNSYALGREIARLEEELREVDYLLASADGPRLIGGPNRAFYRGFGSQGFLIDRRVEIKNALRYLKAEAARS